MFFMSNTGSWRYHVIGNFSSILKHTITQITFSLVLTFSNVIHCQYESPAPQQTLGILTDPKIDCQNPLPPYSCHCQNLLIIPAIWTLLVSLKLSNTQYPLKPIDFYRKVYLMLRNVWQKLFSQCIVTNNIPSLKSCALSCLPMFLLVSNQVQSDRIYYSIFQCYSM